MSNRGALGLSCYACGGTLFQLRLKVYFCANAHCNPGGRVMGLEEAIEAPGSSTSKCVLERCTVHGRGRDENAGNGTDAARSEQVQGVSPALS